MACSAGYHKSAFFFRCYYLGHFDQPLVAQGDIDYLECVMARIAPGTYLDRNGESVVISPDFPVKVLTFGPSSGPLVFDSLRGQAVSQPVLEGEILVETAAGKKLFLRPYHHDNACVGEQGSIPPDHVFSLDDAALQVVSGHYFPEVALRLGLSEATAKAKLRIRLRLFVSLVWQAGMASFRPKQMPSKWDDCITFLRLNRPALDHALEARAKEWELHNRATKALEVGWSFDELQDLCTKAQRAADLAIEVQPLQEQLTAIATKSTRWTDEQMEEWAKAVIHALGGLKENTLYRALGPAKAKRLIAKLQPALDLYGVHLSIDGELKKKLDEQIASAIRLLERHGYVVTPA